MRLILQIINFESLFYSIALHFSLVNQLVIYDIIIFITFISTFDYYVHKVE